MNCFFLLKTYTDVPKMRFCHPESGSKQTMILHVWFCWCSGVSKYLITSQVGLISHHVFAVVTLWTWMALWCVKPCRPNQRIMWVKWLPDSTGPGEPARKVQLSTSHYLILLMSQITDAKNHRWHYRKFAILTMWSMFRFMVQTLNLFYFGVIVRNVLLRAFCLFNLWLKGLWLTLIEETCLFIYLFLNFLIQ